MPNVDIEGPESADLIVDGERVDLMPSLALLIEVGTMRPGQPGRDDGVEFGTIEVKGEMNVTVDGEQLDPDEIAARLKDGLILILAEAAEKFS